MRLSVLALYQSQGNATYLCRNRCHLMHFVHKWLLTFSATPLRLCMTRHTQTCFLKPSHALASLQSTSSGLVSLRSTLSDLMSLVPSSGALWHRQRECGGHTELRSHWAFPPPKPTGLDNTVGPVPKTSGYVFNTLQSNSAAHAPNTNRNLINEDTHICDLNLYETVFINFHYIILNDIIQLPL